MIESFYWKDELLEHAKRLKPVEKPPRWTERLVSKFERDIIISFFCIRKLFENNKISRKSIDHRMLIYAARSKGKEVTLMNRFEINELYDFKNERQVSKSVTFMANQFIHSYLIFPYRREDRNWDGLYVCSDFKRNEFIYRVPIDEIIKLFKIVGRDYPHQLKYTWSEKAGDYEVETN